MESFVDSRLDVNIKPKSEVPPYDVVNFKFTYHENEHIKTNIRQKHSHNKHVKTPIEKEIPLHFKKGSPPTEGKFCQKCFGRGHKGSTLILKHNQIQYFGPVLCKCAIKHLYIEDKTEDISKQMEGVPIENNILSVQQGPL